MQNNKREKDIPLFESFQASCAQLLTAAVLRLNECVILVEQY